MNFASRTLVLATALLLLAGAGAAVCCTRTLADCCETGMEMAGPMSSGHCSGEAWKAECGMSMTSGSAGAIPVAKVTPAPTNPMLAPTPRLPGTIDTGARVALPRARGRLPGSEPLFTLHDSLRL
jgi:hypothetical protein